ncbi:MAG: Zn-dependent alcohol dehydrogenase, partial [Thermodesulfobacteriota bacterium]
AMRIKGLVLREANKPMELEDLELAPPKANEVLVKTAYTGWCHSDQHLYLGEIPIAMPFVIGHEASGVVQEVGPSVTSLKPGDRVAMTWMVPCGKCPQCLRGKGYICSGNFGAFLGGKLLDGTTRLKDMKGREVLHGNFVSGFSDYTVVPEFGCIKVRDDLPLEQACFMGCCVPTGWGAVFHVANIKPGDSVAVWGMGGVGLNTVRAAALRHAQPLFAVDLEGSKEALAKEFGATHFINNSKEDPVPIIQELTGGGVEYAFECIGDPGAIVQAYWATGIGGTLVIPGITPHDKTTNLALMLLPLHQKSILGTLYGNVSTNIDIPRLMNLAADGSLKLDKLIGRKFKIEEINNVIEAMDKREIQGRWVCEWD